MSFLKSLKPNKPVVSFDGYFIAMLGKSKFGKTTFAIDLAKTFYGNLESTLLLAPEIGYKAMDGVYAIPITGFDYAEEDDGEQRGFIEVVDELIENKHDIPFKFIIIDTITALERYAVQYVIRKANREDNPEKRYTDISDIPWGKGYNMVAEEIYSQIDRLKKAGFGVFVIGHEKVRAIKLRDTDDEYDYITFNVLQKTSDIIEREADMIIYGDLITNKEKNGKVTTERKLRFRSDGNILCGTRFRNFPDELPFDVNIFIETFKETILDLYGGDKKAVKAAEQEQLDKKERQTAKFVENAKNNKPPEHYHEEIEKTIRLLKLGTKDKVALAKKFKELLGDPDFRKSDDVEKLKEALEYLETLGSNE